MTKPLCLMRCFCGLALWTLLSPALPLRAQETAESRAYKTAQQAFQVGAYERAERELAQFVAAYPNSLFRAEAVLFQARAAMKLGRAEAAARLLGGGLGAAGLLADQYRFSIGEAHLQQSNYVAAAEAFARFAAEHTNSTRLLEAAYQEALARYRLRDFARVAALLRDGGGTFQRAAAVRTNDLFATRGTLLLAEALIETRDLKAAEETLARLRAAGLPPDLQWHRQYLLCRVQAAGQRLDDALAGTTNLLALAAASADRPLLAASVSLQGSILRQLNELDAAALVYTNNLADTVPQESRRQAVLHLIELKLAQGRTADAAQMLEAFLAQHPGDAASDAMLLAHGELLLRAWLESGTNAPAPAPADNTGTVPATNLLQRAFGQFDKLLRTHTNSPFTGKALLNKGWCVWLEGRKADSAAWFEAAAAALPAGEDLAVARFKLADAHLAGGDFTNALRNYQSVLRDFGQLPRVRDEILEPALYQSLRASLDLGELASASDAVLRLLREARGVSVADRGLLLLGQRFIRSGRAADARALFSDFAKRWPESALIPEVEFAVGKSHVQDQDWAGALKSFDQWLIRFPTNSGRPRVEYEQAWVTWLAGQTTNALRLFTNFVAVHPESELAPRAQHWVGEYHYNAGDFPNAERSFQLIVESTNWPPALLPYESRMQARMMAGRAAYARRSWKDAGGPRGHFTLLVNDNNCPSNLLAEAYFALGDTLTESDLEPNQTPLQKFNDARESFSKIPQLFPDHPTVPAAWGRIGDCYLQLATQDAKLYENASNAYQKVLDLKSPRGSVAVRSQAEYAVGRVLEAQATARPADSMNLFKAAFDRYFNIVSGKLLDPGEQPDPSWLEKASLAAARLAEDQRQWEIAVNIYQRLLEVLPPLRTKLARQMEKAREGLQLEKK